VKKESEQDKANDINSNKIAIPIDFFVDFKEVNYTNKDDFEYLVY
jgi:hypothetical protein